MKSCLECCSSYDDLYDTSGSKGRADLIVDLWRRAALRASRLNRVLAFDKLPFEQLARKSRKSCNGSSQSHTIH